MSYPKNDLFLKTIRREPVPMTPIWIMRQAGRYLPEYRALRERARSFLRLCKTPALACEASLQPIHRYPLDACIIFSDILTVPDAMGLGLNFIENRGPYFERPIREKTQILQLKAPDLTDLEYVYETIRMVKLELNDKVPLIGFAGSPWTLAAYMIEGESKPHFPSIINMMEKEPLLLHKLLNVLAESVCAHLNAQIKAGVQAVMIFDTWGGMLDKEKYQIFSLSYIKQIMTGLLRTYHDQNIPVILFTKGGGASLLTLMAETKCDMVGVDAGLSLAEARHLTEDCVALQGNMDPMCLTQSPDVIRDEVERILASFGHGSGHVFNLGHGITKETPPENVAVLIDAVHEQSLAYHKERLPPPFQPLDFPSSQHPFESGTLPLASETQCPERPRPKERG